MGPRWIAFLFPMLLLAGCASAPTKAPPPSVVAPMREAVSAPTGAVREAVRQVDGVRPAFRTCVEAAGGAVAATHACIEAEMQFQQQRLDGAIAARRARGAGAQLDTVQSQWSLERDRLCSPADGGDLARIRAAICRLEATAARADVLGR